LLSSTFHFRYLLRFQPLMPFSLFAVDWASAFYSLPLSLSLSQPASFRYAELPFQPPRHYISQPFSRLAASFMIHSAGQPAFRCFIASWCRLLLHIFLRHWLLSMTPFWFIDWFHAAEITLIFISLDDYYASYCQRFHYWHYWRLIAFCFRGIDSFRWAEISLIISLLYSLLSFSLFAISLSSFQIFLSFQDLADEAYDFFSQCQLPFHIRCI